MHNLSKYAYTYCPTCTWSCTGGCGTQCDITDDCKKCDNYNHLLANCKCSEEARDAVKCPHYKKYTDEGVIW